MLNLCKQARFKPVRWSNLVNSASLDALSGGQILRYLNGREMEAVNLRLILLGRANGIAKEAIEERMRLGYHDN